MTETKFAVFNRESAVESIVSDLVTFGFLCFSIWFSHEMGGGFWEAVCFAMLLLWLSVKLPMETKRVVKFSTKAEALDWVNALPDDQD